MKINHIILYLLAYTPQFYNFYTIFLAILPGPHIKNFVFLSKFNYFYISNSKRKYTDNLFTYCNEDNVSFEYRVYFDFKYTVILLFFDRDYNWNKVIGWIKDKESTAI